MLSDLKLKNSKADYLLTGDGDLLELKEFYGARILKLTDYLKRSG
jgi:predicted nucleic acid-binding protein